MGDRGGCASDTLQTLITKINGLDAGVSAAESNDGSSINPFRFTLTSNATGRASQILFDTSQAGFSLLETAQGQDAFARVIDDELGRAANQHQPTASVNISRVEH